MWDEGGGGNGDGGGGFVHEGREGGGRELFLEAPR